MSIKPKPYDHNKIEPKWQKEWEKKGVYKTSSTSKKPKKYVLDMFPYPSGAGLHVGHPRGYIASDVYARLMRMKGFNVLHPMGFDSFGLPAEQYAIKTGNNPKIFTDKLVKQYRKQLDIIGFSYDWSRQIATHRPEYYKWTQWIFLKLYGAWYNKDKDRAEPIETLVKIFEKGGNEKVNAVCDADTPLVTSKEWKSMSEAEKQNLLMKYRLAYEGFSEVNWCGDLGTVLANDEIVDGPDGKPVSERGGFSVEKKSLRQWFLRITAYADRLLGDLGGLDWPGNIKEIQKNWIGRSVGSQIGFKIYDSGLKKELLEAEVFTTRADTLFGVTYIVLAPEVAEKFMIHDSGFRNEIQNPKEVEKYIQNIKEKTDEDRTANKEKTGIELRGVRAINPANGEEVPVWIADYVLASYGTGAVMAVPAHDERDFAFAKKYNLPVREVVVPQRIDKRNPPVPEKKYVERFNVHAIVLDKSKNALVLKWKKHNWTTFPMGGVDEGEDVVMAARREVLEETGYKNLKFIRVLGGSVRAEYFAAHKDQNRIAFTKAVVFEIENDEREEVKAEESDQFSTEWVPFEKLTAENMSHSEMDVWLERFKIGDSSFDDDGVLVNSNNLNGLSSKEARKEITNAVGGKFVTKYKIRDAVFARQRYWGEPIPLVHEKNGTIKSLKEKDLPLELPNIKSYAPTGNGESPLSSVKDWVKKGYETNTMPGWAGSSWYYFRYMDPQNKSMFAGEKSLKYWKQVDMYVGGAEHATGHLLYSRFWNKFLYDLKLVPENEPFKAMRNQGMILGTDNRKMSKRWGNVVNPDDVVKTYGADTLRVFEMFIGPFDSQLPWSIDGIVGSRRFVEKIWRLQEKVSEDKKADYLYEQTLHKTIKKVGEDIESFNFNTAISAMMILVNEMEKSEKIYKEHFMKLLKILSPFAPHITEEIWKSLGGQNMLHEEGWPKFDHKKLVSNTVTIAVQVNGKVRGELKIATEDTESTVLNLAKEEPQIAKWLEGGEVVKVVFVPGRLINIVVKV